ncbi:MULTISPECIES: aminoglycoside phosphotransferase family protein [Streptomyces]|uniref:Aminoglycoside phosphotransferase family protein n=1 Tax=Streptomyces fuscus TaxID=3048495 RepID=A0ABT7J8M0_9ACTN|nr:MULTISPECIES: aminoglycoside phosphotransferase family protein [Streptomyces]MCM1977254.1 aminoglycoside phosphotransferase family protein [Streptomyces sp. G1]MDL2081216.1 aminoglycoside phosphotransferase family protein [Streptomyces fuscus]SBT90920.1 Predicted kinase, aminoglycoside phosphotransferase (APT) family [Streptomyces sp. DI166]
MTQAPTPTADTVRRLVRSLLKDGADDTAGPEVRPVAPGDEAVTWWVGARHVLRLAPDRDGTVRQRREMRLRDLVRPHLPVAVPTSVAHGEWAPGLAYTLDTKLPGGSAEVHDVSAVGEADLAGLLTGLREVSVRQAEAIGVPRTGPRSLEALRRAAERAAARLAEADEFDPARLHQLTPPAAVQLAAQPGTAVLVHHGLTGEHLVVSADGRVRGVLGWTDAVVGDPAEDIAGLARAVGSPAAVRAATLAGYGARPCLRGLWLARCDTVIHLAEALDRPGRTPLPELRRRLELAWEAILLERVTELREDDDPDEGP